MDRTLDHRAPSPLVARIRWVMVGAIVVSTLLTLICQPNSFWLDPTTAIRGDGLPIHHPTNHTFEFFLGNGAVAYLAANLIYMALAFFIVSRLPRTVASLVVFSLLFAHGYGAANWLGVHFGLGVGPSPALWGTACGIGLSFAILPTVDNPRRLVRQWRWLMVAALFVDFAFTLWGQPASYWHDPSTMLEGNSVTRLFLGRSWLHLLGMNIAYAAGEFALVTFLPLPVAFVCVFGFTFGSFSGATNWLFYVWRLGWPAVIGYGVVLSILMVMPALRDRRAEGSPR